VAPGHYPRFFAALAGVSTISALYILQFPGAGFGLVALLVLGFFSLLNEEKALEILLKKDGDAKGRPAQPVATSAYSTDALSTALEWSDRHGRYA